MPSSNCSCFGAPASKIHGMIDANAYHCDSTTWPSKLAYVQEDGKLKPLKEVVEEKFPYYNQGLSTVEMGNELVKHNTKMYNMTEGVMDAAEWDNQDNDGEDAQDKKNIPSLIIATTMDMEFAHIGGYNGNAILCSCTSDFQVWENQIEDMERAAASNPLRLFPLLCYDPRRNSLPNDDSPEKNACGWWKKPFGGIVGCEDPANGFNKIWFGFCMNPALGFRPFDEFCEYLPNFYENCEKEEIPILARCARDGIIAHNAVDVDFPQTSPITTYRIIDKIKIMERLEKSKKRNERLNLPDGQKELCSDWYRGEKTVDNTDLDHFCMNYGHPRNWIPVLKCFPGLRLCLAGFGGNSEWQHESMTMWAKNKENNGLPPREWIRCIIQLTQNNNVYADISGLNIHNDDIWTALQKMLKLIQSNHKDFEHLKCKLIFGSGWYFSDLTNMPDNTEQSSQRYRDYCHKFKKLFDEVDPTGEFWERVSLVNPWKFYGLSKEKVDNFYEALDANKNVNREMLKEMKSVFYDSKGCELGLIDYVNCRKQNDPVVIPQAPDEKDGDLAAYKILPHTQYDIYEKFKDYHYKEILKKLESVGINKELGEDSVEIGNLLRWLWCGYENKLRVHKINSIGGKAEQRCSQEEKENLGAMFDPDGISTDLVYDTCLKKWTKAYQITFHELFHNIDHLVGKREKKRPFDKAVYFYSAKEDYNFGITIIKDAIKLDENSENLNKTKNLDRYSQAYLYDIIGGALHYNIYNDKQNEYYGHGPEQWLSDGVIHYLLHENKRKVNKEELEDYIYKNTRDTDGFNQLMGEVRSNEKSITDTFRKFVDIQRIDPALRAVKINGNHSMINGRVAKDSFEGLVKSYANEVANVAMEITTSFTSEDSNNLHDFYNKTKRYADPNSPNAVVEDICAYFFPQRLAAETFANMASAAVVNPPAFRAMKEYLPESYKVFMTILRHIYERSGK